MGCSYSITTNVRYSEIDSHKKMGIPSIINYFQDLSTVHSEALGVGIEFLRKRHCAWILTSWVIDIIKYPEFNEEITVKTWPTAFRGLFGWRNFTIENTNGDVLVRANSLWVFMDVSLGRPAKIPVDVSSSYTVGEPIEMEDAPRKMKLPKEAISLEPMKVRKEQIDTNQHMNNCQYVADALEVTDAGANVKKIRVEYKKSAVYGDVLYPKLAKEEKKHMVELCDEAGAVYAIVEFEE